MLEAGQYLIKKFYDNNYDNAKASKKAKVKSLSELIRRINKEAGGTPSKTWIYDAVKLAVDDKDYNSSPDYQKIVHSNKVVLTHVQEKDMKEQLITETAEKGYSVEKLKERIRELKGIVPPSDLPSDAELKKMSEKDLFFLQSQINWRYESITETLAKYTKSKNRIDSIIEELGYVKEEKKKKK
jgi:predicted RND superfamily exporter protein